MIRWGVIGPGGIARQFADAMPLVDGGEIVAVASRSLDRANEYAERYGVAQRYADTAALLADPEVDAIYVATPHARHEQDAVAALEAGKHVLCEKPMALDAGQVRRMIDLARDRSLFLMEAIWSRFLPSYVALGERLAAGAIGEPLVVQADFGIGFPPDRTHRNFQLELGGGALLDLGIYPLQLCSLVLGPIEEVTGTGVLGPTGVDERVAAVLRHTGGGLGVATASLTVTTACTARITGTDGWIDLPAFMHCPQSFTVNVRGVADVVDCSYTGDGLQFEIAEVHRCLGAGLTESPSVTLDESLRLATAMDTVRAQMGLVYPASEGMR